MYKLSLTVLLLANVAFGSLRQRGTQFITGPCNSDSDCANGCCGFNSGKCAGAIVAQERDGGCGHGDPFPNNNAAIAIAGPNAPKAAGVPAAGSAGGNAGNAGAATPPPATTAAAPPAKGTQFITGACNSDADCANGCCGFNSGKCAGAIVAQERDGGCGHGDPFPNNNAAIAIAGPNAPKAAGVPAAGGAASPPPPPPAATQAAPATTTAAAPPAKGTQFITGPCDSDADCANGCCGFNTGKCAGAIVAQERDGGCGHGDAQPNNNAAIAIAGPNAPKAPGVGAAGGAGGAAAPPPPPAATTAAAPAAKGTQFITGPCASDSECANGCCGFNSGKCAGAIVAQERDGGCGHGDAQPNNNAAIALVGPNAPKPGQKA